MSSQSQSLPRLSEVEAAADSEDYDKIRDQLHAVFSSRRSGSSEQQQQLLRGIATVMTRSENLIDAMVDVLWLESHSGCSDEQEPAETASSSSSSPLVQFLKILREENDKNGAASENSELLRHGLIENVNATVLDQSGWMPEKDLSKRIRLYNTQSYYKQFKFNLLAEESQGYAKYLEYLISLSPRSDEGGAKDGPIGADDDAVRQRQVQTLIGTFSLDPNRCLDIAIDVMLIRSAASADATAPPPAAASTGAASANTNDDFLPVLKVLPLKHLPEILMLTLQRRGPPSAKSKLFAIATWMVRRHLLDADKMFDYLLTEKVEDQLSKTHQAAVHARRESVRDSTRVRLGGGPVDTSKADGLAQKAMEMRSELSETHCVRWIKTLVQDKVSYKSVLPCLTCQQWSQLCGLFPMSIGVALCDVVTMILDEETDAPKIERQYAVPWNNADSSESRAAESEDEDAMELDLAGGPSKNDLEELVLKVGTILEFTRDSGCISLRPVLYTRLCRLFAYYLDESKSNKKLAVTQPVVYFFKTFMLTSLSLFSANPVMGQEVWQFLRHIPYQTRYDCYHYWRGGGLEKAAIRTDKPLWLVQGEIQAGKDARYALKRLSKDTIRETSRSIAKVCHTHPLVVFTTILNQIESYDNLVSVMVDALRFTNPLSLDVLSSCILSRLSGDTASAMMVNRSRLKEDGVNVSQWLQSLEAFVGAFYKRFPRVDFRGILNYLVHRLKEGHVMELGILKALLKNSGGWGFQDYSPAASLSATQLEGRAGSNLLRRETMNFGIIEEIDWKASNEVRRVLQADDIGISLLILLSQVRHQIVFASQRASSSTPIKLVANLVDNCQVVMSILLEFLTDPSVEEENAYQRNRNKQAISVYAKSLPKMQELFKAYKLDVASCWMLCRPLIAAARALTSGEETGEVKDVKAADPLEGYKSSEASLRFYKEMLPDRTWSSISVELFEVFFSHSLYDIYCPESVYANEISRLEKVSQAKNTPPPQSASGMSPAPPLNDPDEEQVRVKRVTSRLSADLEKQKKHVIAVREAIASKKDRYFPSHQVSREAAAVFLSRCLYPRCMQSPDDALYCAQFISILHETETPGFGTLHLCGSLVVALSRAMFGMTEGEAANASILLNEVWKSVSKWRYDEKAYAEGVAGKPGSFMVRESGSKGDGADENDVAAEVSYKDYEELYNNWHAALGASALGALKSPEYIHNRNCLIILTRMVDAFPTRPGLANRLLRTLEPLQDESNSFADIRASAQAYSMQLTRARDVGKFSVCVFSNR